MASYQEFGEEIIMGVFPSTSRQQPRQVVESGVGLGDLPSNNYNPDLHGNLQCTTRRNRSWVQQRQRSRAANNVVLNLPSHTRQPGAGDETSSSNLESGEAGMRKRVMHIVSEMGKDSMLMDDNPLAEQLRMETLREMPEPLTLKRTLRRELGNTVISKSKRKNLGLKKRIKYSISIALSKMSAGLKNLTTGWQPWYESLKIIEGHFGSGVATYFNYVRWLLLLNLCVCILSCSFIVFPQLLYKPTEVENASTSNVTFSFSDIFTGEGYMAETILFYGYYANESTASTPDHSYSIPNAYFFTSLVTYIIAFIVVSTSMARSYRVTFIQTSVGGLKHVYAHKVFCSWDFGIATPQAAELKAKSITNEIKELLSEETRVEEMGCQQWLAQGVVHGLCLALVAGMGYLTWILVSLKDTMLVSAVVTLTLIAAPLFFSYLLRFEGYRNPRTALYVTLFRMFLLQVVMLAMVVAYWIEKSSTTQCWETELAQEIYRLVLMDFWLAILATSLVEFIRSRLGKSKIPWFGEPEFDIASNTLGLIYTQTLLWVGAFFSPLLPLIVVLKMFITFHVRRAGALRNCTPAQQAWRAAQTRTFFLALSFLALIIVLSGLGYIITQVRPSADCGPFRGYKYVYEIVLLNVLHLNEDNGFWKFILFLTKPGVVAGVLIAIGAGVYYVRAQALAQRRLVEILQEMLRLEASDKEFLLANISKLTQGRWTMEADFNYTSSDDSTREYVSQRLMRYPDSRLSSSNAVSSENTSEEQLLDQWDDEMNDYEGAKIRSLRRKHIGKF